MHLYYPYEYKDLTVHVEHIPLDQSQSDKRYFIYFRNKLIDNMDLYSLYKICLSR